jgi:hypothetical protein
MSRLRVIQRLAWLEPVRNQYEAGKAGTAFPRPHLNKPFGLVRLTEAWV